MPIITFDSNVSHMVNLVNKLLINMKTRRWCVSVCECETLNNECDGQILYYDTPISMCTVSDYPIFSKIKYKFIYINFDKSNQSLKRIMMNLKYLKDYILITNSEKVNIGQYKLVPNNCPDKLIAESIVAIINACMNNNGMPVSANDIIDQKLSPYSSSLPSYSSRASTFDIIKFSENRYPRNIINDCITNECAEEEDDANEV
jgi:hypothetical protein